MKLHRQLPPLRLIIVFQAIAQYRNLSTAARALNVSQPAISKSLRELENWIGTPLVDRTRRPLGLTTCGDVLLAATESGLKLIADAIEEITRLHDEQDKTLKISCSMGFATYWLMKRLPTFTTCWPSIAVNILTTPHDMAPDAPHADVMFRYGHGNWTDGEVIFLFHERIEPVASPEFVENAPFSLDNLANIPLIHVDVDDASWRSWNGYLTHMGFPLHATEKDMRFNNYVQATQATLHGLGVMLGWRSITGDLVSEGRLRPLGLPSMVPEEHAYYIVVPKWTRTSPSVQRFVKWVLQVIEEEGTTAPMTSPTAPSPERKDRILEP